ncbi:rhodanese-like domain-containing protein [Desulfurobacterium atlanticum]|uniref:Rhodanese-related sulfurtransferase n=1 Tax=Desulfurobacterium atlanticum TaxID=240169 RepID=A0A238YMQ0_9BACT|nr:rhodanese-like domain-containing protein [Desulfurobacterium atlanticum]SNR72068.1 Rhodanese-related sulfurtransferase [Desulfurobacterium atlanticum]
MTGKNYIKLFSFLTIILFLFSCSGKNENNSFTTITPQKAASLIKKGVTVLDVRTPEEFTLGHIKGAKNYNFMSRDFFEKIKNLDRDKPYIICSRDGRTGKVVSRVLIAEGFKKIYNLENGIVGWSEAGYKLVKEQ